MNFNAGDLAYWMPRGNSAHFRGSLEQLPAFIETLWRRWGITDQILFGDRRPVHRPAVERAERFGIRTHVFEEGYFRPFWVTLEREGVNGHSLLPRDPDWFRAAAVYLRDRPEEKAKKFHSAFRKRSGYDVIYHVAGMLNLVLNPRYQTHSPITAPVEYAGYIYRFARLRFWRKRDAVLIDRLCQEADDFPFFILPLQLNTDAQIRDHSRFDDMQQAMEYILESFARNAPGKSRLLIKNHPLDMGLVDYPGQIALLAKRFGVYDRVEYIETGNLEKAIKFSVGTVTVNSTVGMVSLGLERPTLCLSDPIYNLPGLTWQQGIDSFWREAGEPDKELFEAFRKVVVHVTQINGGFYCFDGIEMAVANAAKVLCAENQPLENLLRACPL
ncbi:capsule biosynthesis protein [Marinobacterium lutimaris]|uniref:capsule biosynthesis protein n=1 Tax=Marinobacterium lutimaris TaxID=568106 RepID=UPI001F2DA582|nr:capsular biosynthesis protein [Marinobacterium lutimaris]